MNPYNSASGKVEVTALPTGFVIYTGRQAERLSADVPKRPASLICVQHDAVAPPHGQSNTIHLGWVDVPTKTMPFRGSFPINSSADSTNATILHGKNGNQLQNFICIRSAKSVPKTGPLFPLPVSRPPNCNSVQVSGFRHFRISRDHEF